MKVTTENTRTIIENLRGEGQTSRAEYVSMMQTKIQLLDTVCRYLFIALDDEVKFCLNDNIEVSEASVEALQKAADANVGKSEALAMIAKED